MLVRLACLVAIRAFEQLTVNLAILNHLITTQEIHPHNPNPPHFGHQSSLSSTGSVNAQLRIPHG